MSPPPDTVHSVLLAVHIAAGGAGLVLAWPTLAVRKRRGAHTLLGRTYVAAVAVMCLTALALVAYDPGELFGLGVVAVATAACAAAGVWLAVRKPRLRGGWEAWHLQMMCSSVISFVTAFAVTMTDGHLLAWVLPTVAGSPLIAYRTAVARGQRPPLRLPGRASARTAG